MSNKAYGLVAMSIILMIAGLLAGGSLFLARAKSITDKSKDAKNKIEQIQKAINKYILENDRLPCPASITKKSTDNDFGTEARTAAGVCDDSVTGVTKYTAATKDVFYGTVPIRVLNIFDDTLPLDETENLNISPDLIIDKMGNKLTYVVYGKFAEQNGFLNSIKVAAQDGNFESNITVKKSTTELKAEAVYVIFSHGKDGIGAYNMDSAFSEGTALSITLADPFVLTLGADDIAVYKTKNNLIKETEGYCKNIETTDTSYDYTEGGRDFTWNGVKRGEYGVANETCPDTTESTDTEYYMARDVSSVKGFKNRPIRLCQSNGTWADVNNECELVKKCTDPIANVTIGEDVFVTDFADDLKHNQQTVNKNCGSTPGTIKFKCVVTHDGSSWVPEWHMVDQLCDNT